MTANFSILTSAKALPKTRVTNQDLTTLMPTSDEWITQRTGIKTRYVATDETTTSLAVSVAAQLLAQSELLATEIDLIVVATMSPDYLTPATATQVQAAIGATNAVAFDINAACAGFVYGMQVVHHYLQPGQTAMLIGSETLSRLVDWHDRNTAVLFGDGAGGMLITNDPAATTGKWLGSQYATFGADGHYLTAGQMPTVNPWTTTAESANWFFQMNGRRVYDFATKQVPRSIEQALGQAQLTPAAISTFILHQANARIITSVGKQLDLSTAQLPMNMARYGNTAAASEPILFSELVANKQLQRGAKLVFTGFGGGLSVGSAVIEY
ncbi:beta-ketoacyl-ACP synthase III [Lactiplantibacillus herbarum]|uniref:beta-ketoacyl-ACP synthase III n=1 Tax=Lactiplantibacillus herbarum TaxID=1670446 RepID=UPI00064E3D27|nr:beta-ketoacyl-ACP synthase III [Lactiplantibacillus herbarum]